jgi:hypothetical protein
MARSPMALISIAAFAAIASGPAVADAPPSLTLVNELPKPVVLTLTGPAKGERSAPLNLVIRNPSNFSGELRLRFVARRTGRIATVTKQSPSPAPTDHPLLLNVGGSLAIGKHQTRLVQLRFTIPRNADPSLLDGVLVINLASKEPKTKLAALVLQTKAGSDTGPEPGSEAPQPVSPALQVTSYFPFKRSNVFGEHQTVLLPPKREELLGREYVIILGSNSGGLLRVTLSTKLGEEASVNGMTRGSIKVDHVGRTGTYSGDLVLGPGANDKLKLTVNVRDFFAWALLALGLGAGLGGYGTHWWEGKRRKQLLIARAKEAYDAYVAYTRLNRPTGIPPEPDAQEGLEKLRQDIKAANTDEDYNKQVDAVAAYEAALSRYKRQATAAKVLRPEDVPDDAAVLKRDVADVRAEIEISQTDAKRADQLTAEAERLAAIVDAFVRDWKLWDQAGRPEDLNPVSCYRTRGGYRTENAARRIRICLIERQHDLEQLELVELEVDEGIRARVGGVLLDLGDLWKRWDELTPAAIQRRIRTFDWAIAFASGLVTLLAFLLTIYDENFGSIGDYAKAFTAGFLGQLAGVAIAWNLFPAFRSYRAARTDAGAKPATTTT